MIYRKNENNHKIIDMTDLLRSTEQSLFTKVEFQECMCFACGHDSRHVSVSF